MRPLLLPLLLCCLFSPLLSGQEDTYNILLPEFSPQHLIVLADGDVAMTGVELYSNPADSQDLKPVVLRLRPDGTVRYRLEGELYNFGPINVNANNRGVASWRENGLCYLYRSDTEGLDEMVLQFFDATGDLVASLKPDYRLREDELQSYLRNVTGMADGGIVATGLGSKGRAGGTNTFPFLTRLDANLNVVFSRSFTDLDSRQPLLEQVLETPDGGLLVYIIGIEFREPNDYNTRYLAKISAAGELEWCKRYTRQTISNYNFLNINNRNLAVASDGNIWMRLTLRDNRDEAVVKLSPTGDYLSGHRIILPNGISSDGSDLLLDEEGKPYLALRSKHGFIQGPGPGNRSVSVRLSEDGVPVSARYTLSPEVLSHVVTKRPGGGYYTVGTYTELECGVGTNRTTVFSALSENLEHSDTTCFPNTLLTVSHEPFGLTISDQGQLFDFPVTLSPSVGLARAEQLSEMVDCPSPVPIEIAVDPVPSLELRCTVAELSTNFIAGSNFLFSENDTYTLVIELTGEAETGTLFLGGSVPGVLSGNGTVRIEVTIDPGTSTATLAQLLESVVYRAPTNAELNGPHSFMVALRSDCDNEVETRDTFTVVSLPILPEDVAGRDVGLCEGGSVLLETDSPTGTRFNWSTGDTTANLLVEETGSYTVSATNLCGTETATFSVSITPDIDPADADERFTICLLDSTVYPLTLDPGTTYRWADDTLLPARRFFYETGNYTLIRSNECSSAETSVRIIATDCCEVYLPTAFSPNGDGINDVFRPFPREQYCNIAGRTSLRVFDRWGSEVYAGDENGWDGSSAGKRDCAPGTYVYILEYPGVEEAVVRTGSIMLLR